MKYLSLVEQRAPVTFPSFAAERVYMLPFKQAEGLPRELERWQPTVDAMLDGVRTFEPIYLMIDQSIVEAGNAQRRPGVHIDGYWQPDVRAHGGGHLPAPRPSHGAGRHRSGGTHWTSASFDAPEAILLASSVTAARALSGVFDGPIGEGGDCSHLTFEDLSSVPLVADYTYAGNVTMLHESLPVDQRCERTLVRLNVPGHVF